MSRRIHPDLARSDIALAAMTYAHSRRMAIDHARSGQREPARWWGGQARQDWLLLRRLLTA